MSDPGFGDDLDDEKNEEPYVDDSGEQSTPASDLLNVMKTFVTDYAKQLGKMREALSETITEAYDAENEVIGLDMQPYDREAIVQMIRTENLQFNKVALVFAILCSEIHQLRLHAENKLYAPLTMFGHQVDDEVKADDEKNPGGSTPAAAPAAGGANALKDSPPEAQMGAFLPFLQDLSNFIHRCYEVTRNLVNQLACLYHERQKFYLSTFKHVRIDYVFESIGELCRVLITLDAIIVDNKAIAFAWTSYKRMIKYVRADPKRYGVEAARLKTFQDLLSELDRTIVSANIFDNFISQDYGLPGGQNAATLVAGNRVLGEQFTHSVKNFLKKLSAGLGESVETYPRENLVDLFGLYALFRRLFEVSIKPDKKLFKQMWEVQKKVPIVLLWGRAGWFVADFLARYCPTQGVSLSPALKEVIKVRKEYLKTLDDDFSKKTEELYMHMCMWMVRIESELVATDLHNVGAVLNARSKLLLNGILLANQIRNLVTVSIHMHLSLDMPFRHSNIRALAVCSEMLKAIELTYRRRVSMIGENITHMMGQTTFTLKRIFHPIKKKLVKTQQLDDMKLDVLAAISLALSLLDRPPTTERLTVLHVALAIAQIKGMLKPNHAEEVRYQLWKLDLLSAWMPNVSRICNCNFLYWVTNLVPACFQDIFDHPDQVNRLPYLFACFRDCQDLLVSSSAALGQADKPTRFLDAYKREVMAHFQETILTPLAREVETDLRLHIHSVVLEQANLRKKQNKDLSRFLELRPIPFFDHVIDVKQRVTHYLDTVFYNLTTVALHDWRIYAEMRNLAHEKYGLNMTEVHLPGTSHYSEALDILEIMRNIHIFVARYNYNMNTQIFVERAFDQKHLNTINIQHIANSIRTHGTGIMNTTVNFTYQFLCRKFIIFSEFLFDDHIKSRLMKDIRYFKQEKEALGSKYPFVRAEKSTRDIRKLGVADDGSSFLDQFRQQITEIGNALGYVRTVRSGGLEHCSNAIKFVPDLSVTPQFHDKIKDIDNLQVQTKQAAINLDNVLDDLSKGFAEGTDYFQVLVAIFKGVFRGDDQKHLKNFYIIAPSLTLSFVEKMIAQKEKIHKQGGRTEASFTDDGFALGLAYILKTLEQEELFDSLHWFESVNVYITERRRVMDEQKGKKLSDEDAQHLVLTAKRLYSLQSEFDLLFYSFSGARIFFRDPVTKEGKENEEKREEERQEGAPSAASMSAPAPPSASASAPAPPAAPASDLLMLPPPAPSVGVPDAPPMAPPI